MSITPESLSNLRATFNQEQRAIREEDFPLVPDLPEGFYGPRQLQRFQRTEPLVIEAFQEALNEIGIRDFRLERDFSVFSGSCERLMSYVAKYSPNQEEPIRESYGYQALIILYYPGLEDPNVLFPEKHDPFPEDLELGQMFMIGWSISQPYKEHKKGETTYDMWDVNKMIDSPDAYKLVGRQISFLEKFEKGTPEDLKEGIKDLIKIASAVPVRVLPKF